MKKILNGSLNFAVGKPIPSSSVRKSQSLQQTAESHSYDDR